MLKILVFVDEVAHEDKLKLKIVEQRLKDGGFKVNANYLIRGANARGEKAIQTHGVKQLPTVVYYMDSKERNRFEGPFTVASYFWKALDLLRPWNPPQRRRRKRRPWEILGDLKNEKR